MVNEVEYRVWILLPHLHTLSFTGMLPPTLLRFSIAQIFDVLWQDKHVLRNWGIRHCQSTDILLVLYHYL